MKLLLLLLLLQIAYGKYEITGIESSPLLSPQSNARVAIATVANMMLPNRMTMATVVGAMPSKSKGSSLFEDGKFIADDGGITPASEPPPASGGCI